MRPKFFMALLLALTLGPSMAIAKPRTATGHMHPQLFRDRAPKIRVREVRPRQGRTSPAKAAAPVVAQGDPFQQ
jgi:hypothetical protein